MRSLPTAVFAVLLLVLSLTAFGQLAITPERAVSAPPSLVPSNGVSQVDIASNGELMLAVWVETRAATPSIIAARVTADGEVLDPAGIILSQTQRYTSSQPYVAWDGEAFVVVWSRLPRVAPFTLETLATRVDPEGRVLRPGGVPIAYGTAQALAVRGRQVAAVVAEPNVIAPGISRCNVGLLSSDLEYEVASSVAPCDNPRLTVFGPGYLLAWTVRDRLANTVSVRALRLHENAGVLGSEFPVHGLGPFAFGTRIAAAQSGSDVLIAAGGERLDVVRVTPQLNIKQATPPEENATAIPTDIVVLEDGTYDVVVQQSPFEGDVLRYSPADRFVAAQEAIPAEQSAAATVARGRTFIASAGQTITGQFVFGHEELILISRRPEKQTMPSLATRGERVLAVWNENRGAAHDVVLARFLALDGRPVSETFVVDGEAVRGYGAAGSDGAGPFVAWFDERSTNEHILTTLAVRRVTEAGLGSEIILSRSAHLDAAPVIADDGSNALLAWVEGPHSEPRVVAGTLSGVKSLIQGTTDGPALAWSGETYLLAANGENGRVRGAVLDRTAGVRSVFDLTTTPAKNPSLAWNGNAYLLVYEREGFLESILLDSEGRELAAKTTLALPDADFRLAEPRVAWDGRTFLVTWSAVSTKLGRGLVVVRRVAANGTPQGAPVVVADTGLDTFGHALTATMMAYPRIETGGVPRVFTRRVTEGKGRAVRK